MNTSIKLALSWIRNNAVTLVEVLQHIYRTLELFINGLARIIPGNTVIVTVHDYIAKGRIIFTQLKEWLLKFEL